MKTILEIQQMHYYSASLTEQDRMIFTIEVTKRQKSRTTAFLLTLFLGGIGAHRFYLGQVGLGVIYALFFWTFIPAITAFVELFLIMPRVDGYNAQVMVDVATGLYGRVPRQVS